MNLREEGVGIFLHTLSCFPFTEYEVVLISQDEKQKKLKSSIYTGRLYIFAFHAKKNKNIQKETRPEEESVCPKYG